MSGHRLTSLLSLVRQGLAIEIGYGTHSIEALLWVAESVEEAVYVPGSLAATASGVGFELANPPLRAGAFRAVRVAIDGRLVPPDAVRFRTERRWSWRTAASVGSTDPFVMLPGEPTQFEAAPWAGPPGHRMTVRLELESVAIPPLVWVEFTDTVLPRGLR